MPTFLMHTFSANLMPVKILVINLSPKMLSANQIAGSIYKQLYPLISWIKERTIMIFCIQTDIQEREKQYFFMLSHATTLSVSRGSYRFCDGSSGVGNGLEWKIWIFYTITKNLAGLIVVLLSTNPVSVFIYRQCYLH